MSVQAEVRDNPAQNRYETTVDGVLAIAEYRRDGDALVFTHTLVPEAIGGRGVGTALIRGALDDARTKNLKVVPRCSFVVDFMRRHTDYRDLLAEDARL